MREGAFPNFNEAFTQLHLSHLIASKKCQSRDRRYGMIDPNADHIARDSLSARPCVDEDGIARHYYRGKWLVPPEQAR